MSLKRRGHSYWAWPTRLQYSQACGEEAANGEEMETMDRATGMHICEVAGEGGARPRPGAAGGGAGPPPGGGGSHPLGVANSPEKKEG